MIQISEAVDPSNFFGSQHPNDCEIIRRLQPHAMNVHTETTRAVHAWATLENLQRRIDRNERFRNALNPFPSDLRIVCSALFADVVLALLRVSDDPSTDRSTLCVLADVLVLNDQVRALLLDDRWLDWQGSLPSRRTQRRGQIDRFTALVPAGWKRGFAPPTKHDLAAVRELLRPLRNQMLAHSSKDIPPHEQPKRTEMLAALHLCSSIARDALDIFTNIDLDILADYEALVETSGNVWGPFETSLLRQPS